MVWQISRHCAVVALFAVSFTGIVALRTIPTAQAESASSDSRTLFEGDWEGVLVSRPLTFRFRLENGVLLGWFVSAKNGQLYPLKNVQAKKRTLSFVHASNPELTVVMTLDKNNTTLAGISTQADGATSRRTLVRKQ